MEAKFESYIFEPNKKVQSNARRWNLLGWMTCVAIIILLVLELDLIAFLFLIALLTVCFGNAFSRWNKVKPLNGSLHASFQINADEIRVGTKRFAMDEVRVTNFLCYDYFGKSTKGYALFVKYPAISNATANVLVFVYPNMQFQCQVLIASVQDIFLLEDIVVKHTSQLVRAII